MSQAKRMYDPHCLGKDDPFIIYPNDDTQWVKEYCPTDESATQDTFCVSISKKRTEKFTKVRSSVVGLFRPNSDPDDYGYQLAVHVFW